MGEYMGEKVEPSKGSFVVQQLAYENAALHQELAEMKHRGMVNPVERSASMTVTHTAHTPNSFSLQHCDSHAGCRPAVSFHAAQVPSGSFDAAQINSQSSHGGRLDSFGRPMGGSFNANVPPPLSPHVEQQ